ncbi:MAG: acyltransferase [Candidatus Eisenbacteria bacterium]|uniref:Acyltransferase n=1 Tax=Eiseniibacteriota bacterium TaxID=2212470 RepID=A0A938BQL3_UNCEI|nr:acyltransferase [Candidatus Eisenbacteria bacterium]
MRPCRRWIRGAVLGLLYVLVLPWGLAARLCLRLAGSVALFDLCAQAFALLPGLPGCLARSCYYKQTMRASHLDARFQFGSLVSKADARIGRGVYVGLWSSIGLADVGDGAVIANRVGVLSGRHQHDFGDPSRPPMGSPSTFTRISIGGNCFIGDNAVVMADVGRGTIVGAGAVVVRPLPEEVLAVGSPARAVRARASGQA